MNHRRRAKPLQMYKDLIDELVDCRKDMLGDWIIEGVWGGQRRERAKVSALLAELNPRQRRIVAHIAQKARDGGIHDTLVVLNERQHYNELRLVQYGLQLPVEPFGTQMFYDWVCRLAGDPWPDEHGALKKRVKPNRSVQPTRQKRRAADRGR